MTRAGTGPVTTRSTSPSASSSRSCSASTLGVIGVPRRRRPAKWDSPWASQYSRVSFHFPPIAANAAAIGQPGNGLGREGLPAGAFLSMAVLHSDSQAMTVPYRRILIAGLSALMLIATAASGDAAPPPASSTVADAQRDFDWEIGTWRSTVRVLAEPLSESVDEWLEFAGTSVVRPLLDRRANVLEFEVSGQSGRIEGLNLRLYEPQDSRWSLTFVNIRDGLLTPAVYGGFRNGVGEFYGDDQLGGRPIKVRFLIRRQGQDRATFEQAFSSDGGATWETNWIAVDRRR